MERREVARLVFLVSFACLACETILFRLLAFLFGYHFVSLLVALATLGYGASGSLAPLLSQRFKRHVPYLFGISLLLCGVVFAFLPLDVYQFFVQPVQWVYLGVLLLVVFLPFFFHGLLQVVSFELFPESFPSFYALNFIGSALGVAGALLVLLFCDELHALFVLVVLLGLVGAKGKRRVLALSFLPFVFLPLRPFLSPYSPSRTLLLIPETKLLRMYRSPTERLEVFSSPYQRIGWGLSPLFRGIPPQAFTLVYDHTNAFSFPEKADPSFLQHLLVILPFEILRPEHLLVVEEREGLAVYAAAFCGVRGIDFVTKSSLFASFLKDSVPSFPAQVHVALPRKFITTGSSLWDMIFVRVPVGRATVFPGSFSFEEDFLFTVEGMESMFRALTPQGVGVFSLFLQNPPSVLPKLVLLLREALGEEFVRERLIVVKSLDFALVLVKRAPWREEEIEGISRFVRRLSFDFVYGPWSEGEMEQVFQTGKRYYEAVRAALEGKEFGLFDLRPSRDDRPYFVNFFRLRALRETLEGVGKRWLPFGGAGFLVVLFVLGVVGGFSAGFVLLPALWGKQHSSPYRVRFLLGGICTGTGFMFVEIPLFTYLGALVGFPLYAFSLLLVVLLFFSGLGSFSVFKRGSTFPRVLLYGHALVLLGCFLSLSFLRGTVLGFLPLLSFLCVLPVLALLGYFLGFPFPLLSQGVRCFAPSLFGEVFAWNGFFSVLSSLLAHTVSLFWGLRVAFLIAVFAYFSFSLLLGPFLPGERDKENRS